MVATTCLHGLPTNFQSLQLQDLFAMSTRNLLSRWSFDSKFIILCPCSQDPLHLVVSSFIYLLTCWHTINELRPVLSLFLSF